MFEKYKFIIMTVALVGILMSAFFFGYRYRGYIEDSRNLTELENLIAEKSALELRVLKISELRERSRIESVSKIKDLEKRIDDEIQKDDAYRCVVPAGGLRILSEAVAHANAR